MAHYIVRRLLLMAPTLIGVTAVVFFVMALSPGGFAGVLLSDTGAQKEGDEARRIRQYFERRYGLDKPLGVQYLSWLNRVSPIGFRMARDLQFSDEQRAAAEAQMRSAKLGLSASYERRLVDAAMEAAAYWDVEPAFAADVLTGAAMRTDAAVGAFQAIDTQAPPGFADQFAALVDEQPVEAARLFVSAFRQEMAGRDRVLFSRPAFKVPDLGDSLRGRPVGAMVVESLKITLLLNAISLPLIYAIAIATGLLAARYRGGLFDVGSGFALLGLWSVPVIWVGVLLIGYLANEQFYRWFPSNGLHALGSESMPFLPHVTAAGWQRGWLLDALWHLVLPVVCLTYGGFAVLAKLTRGAILENLSADFVRTARAKGVDERSILMRHVLRNSILPLITVAATISPAMCAGSVVVENIFSLNGMGKLAVDAAFMKDRELVMGTTLMAGLIGLSAELLRDLWYAVADPRVSYE